MSEAATWRDVIQNLALLVGALTPIILAIMNQNQKKAADKAAADRTIVKEKLESTTSLVDSKLEQIHTTVNGNTRQLLDEIKQLREERERDKHDHDKEAVVEKKAP